MPVAAAIRTRQVKADQPVRVLHLGSPTGMYGAERWILALARHLSVTRVRILHRRDQG